MHVVRALLQFARSNGDKLRLRERQRPEVERLKGFGSLYMKLFTYYTNECQYMFCFVIYQMATMALYKLVYVANECIDYICLN